MSFVGSFNHSLDAKKRVFIPAKYREELGAEFYITRKFDPYLSIYTAKDWEEYVEQNRRKHIRCTERNELQLAKSIAQGDGQQKKHKTVKLHKLLL